MGGVNDRKTELDGLGASAILDGDVLTLDSEQGLQSEKDDKGDQGIQGEKGEKGEQGLQGIQGADGKDGADVSSDLAKIGIVVGSLGLICSIACCVIVFKKID